MRRTIKPSGRNSWLKLSRHLVLLVLAAWASACTVLGPEYKQPETPVTDQWSLGLEEGLHTGAVDHAQWWKLFNDPVLDDLVELARKQNLLLEIASLRVLESRAQLALATGLKYPQVQVLGGDANYVSPAQSDILKLLNVDNFWQFLARTRNPHRKHEGEPG